MENYRILVVDDEESMLALLSSILTKEGYQVVTAGNGQAAIGILGRQEFNMVISDLKMPGVGGLELVQHIRELYPETLTVMLTAHGTIDIAVEAMKQGAWDFLTKPLDNPDQLRLVVRKAAEKQRLVRENVVMKEANRLEERDSLVYHDPKMAEVMELIEMVAPTDSTVLITGESGTGKELAAREIHQQSPRAGNRFVAVNCAALPENLLESELFGHEKGAFTGAMTKKIGFFEMAHRGTLFLDEIGEVSQGIQVKLLRVLQEREFTRVGGTVSVKVDVRVIAATNKDMAGAVKRQAFREDLYYRLNIFPIDIPPLRERKMDILPLANHFLVKWAQKTGKGVRELGPDAESALQDYHWPGNARELSNVIERAVILCPAGEPVKARYLNLGFGSRDCRLDHPPEDLKTVERETIISVLEVNGGNRKKASEQLGISLRSLYYKIKEFGIE